MLRHETAGDIVCPVQYVCAFPVTIGILITIPLRVKLGKLSKNFENVNLDVVKVTKSLLFAPFRSPLFYHG